MNGALTDTPAGAVVPSFTLVEAKAGGWKHRFGVGLTSLSVHVLILLAADAVLRLPVPAYSARQIVIEARPRDVVPLVAPPSTLTQKAPNRGEITKEFNIASLPPRIARPNVPASPGAAAQPRQKFVLPNRTRPGVTTSPIPEAPALDLRAGALPPPALGLPTAPPPPQIQPQETPKLTFEKPGVPMGTAATPGAGRVNVPRPAGSVEEALRQATRSGGRGLVVGDEDGGGAGVNPSAPSVPIPGKLGSAVELLSDPMGTDFWPYLVKVLSAVRRNWFAVIPESARLGRPGRVVIQFAISRDGSVPKLVIATPSGTDALDRAAVAGVSASNPFPPLPSDFKGNQIRLQFVFKYNVR